ncbi:Calcium uptake protein 1 homolog, mitochondrial [Sergentomyia squamirostris]
MSSLRFSYLVTRRLLSTGQVLPRTKILPPLAAFRFPIPAIAGNPGNQQTREFKDFGHKPDPAPNLTKFFYTVVGLSLFLCSLNYKGIKKMIFPKVDADTGVNQDTVQNDDTDSEVSESEGDGKTTEKKKEKIGFRDRKIIEYENRIRTYSTPDKIFRYFATIRIVSGDTTEQVFMTPFDFLRSLTPGMQQPDGLGLDQYRRYDPKSVTERLDLSLEQSSIFYKLGSYGLISFSDYIFLLTVLSTSRRHFEIAFQMFDLNGDGDVDCEEFEKVATLIRQQTSIGNRHRDHANTGNTFKGVNSALTTYFFGPKNDQKLTIEKFLEFQKQLQREILTLEFSRKNPDESWKISEVEFAELLLAYAGYTQKKKAKKMKLVKKRYKEESLGITKDDYLDFFHFLNNINDVDTALTFYHIAGAAIDHNTLKHVARTVAHVELSDHVIEVVFTIFDENLDGQLSNREFIGVMKNRLQRGLEKPKDTGFVKFMYSVLKCAKDTKPAFLGE